MTTIQTLIYITRFTSVDTEAPILRILLSAKCGSGEPKRAVDLQPIYCCKNNEDAARAKMGGI